MSLPLNLVLLVAILVVVNWVTFTGVWWVQWAALGLAVAWLVLVLRIAEIRWHDPRGRWVRVALLVFGIVWLTSLIRTVRHAAGF